MAHYDGRGFEVVEGIEPHTKHDGMCVREKNKHD